VIYSTLDRIRRDQVRASGKTQPMVKRVSLSMVSPRLPCLPIYPFMVRHSWFDTYVQKQGLAEDWVEFDEDPSGYSENTLPPVS
jgi:hypothetical protein